MKNPPQEQHNFWLKSADLLAKADDASALLNQICQVSTSYFSDITFTQAFISKLDDINSFSLSTQHPENTDVFLHEKKPNDKITNLLLNVTSKNELVIFDPKEYCERIDHALCAIALPLSIKRANQHVVLVLGFPATHHPDLTTLNTLLDLLRFAETLLDSLHHKNQLKEYATYDHLTGLLNRRAIHEILEREHGRAERHQRRYSILFLDIDNFKAINDLYGHNIGDQALKEIAINSSDVLREGDWIGRWGGEEFICILPDTTVKGAENIANRLCHKTTCSQLVTENHRIPLTVSIGIACFPDDGIMIDELLEHADDGLLHAKNSGKNCVKRQPPKQRKNTAPPQ